MGEGTEGGGGREMGWSSSLSNLCVFSCFSGLTSFEAFLAPFPIRGYGYGMKDTGPVTGVTDG